MAVDAHPMSVVVRTFTTMTRQPGHETCPPCKCPGPYGDHCRHDHLPWRALSVRDHMMLEVESRRYKYAGAKEQDIRELFDMSATRYYAALGALIDNDQALKAEPALVGRLRRLRDVGREARSAVRT